ncbi:MAG: Crp/Fnr family transcriptional regulator [Peptococcaceae bacterium]
MKIDCTLKDAVSPWLKNSFPQIKKYTDHCEKTKIKRGTVLISPGERSSILFYVLKGKLKVSLVHIDGQEKMLSLIGQGSMIYEGSMFTNNISPVLVTALENCELAYLNDVKIKELMEKDLQFSYELLNYIYLKYKQLVFLHQGVLFSSPSQRFCRLICVLSDTFGEKHEDKRIVNLGFTQAQLAELLGVSRVTVSTILKDMRQKNIITTKNRSLIFDNKICTYCQSN